MNVYVRDFSIKRNALLSVPPFSNIEAPDAHTSTAHRSNAHAPDAHRKSRF